MSDAFEITNWWTGGFDPWLRLDICSGPMESTVAVDSRTAREVAIDVLASQGPCLLYQPPNDSMKEHTGRSSGYPITANSDRLRRRQERWPKRKQLDKVMRALVEEIRESFVAADVEAIAHELLRSDNE